MSTRPPRRSSGAVWTLYSRRGPPRICKRRSLTQPVEWRWCRCDHGGGYRCDQGEGAGEIRGRVQVRSGSVLHRSCDITSPRSQGSDPGPSLLPPLI